MLISLPFKIRYGFLCCPLLEGRNKLDLILYFHSKTASNITRLAAPLPVVGKPYFRSTICNHKRKENHVINDLKSQSNVTFRLSGNIRHILYSSAQILSRMTCTFDHFVFQTNNKHVLMFLVRYSYETSSPNIAVIQLTTKFFWTWLLKVLFLKKILSLAQLFFP